MKEDDYYMPRISAIKITKKDNIYENYLRVSLPHLKQEIPLFILFKALGSLNDKEIVNYIIDNDNSKLDKQLIKILHLSIEEGNNWQIKKIQVNPGASLSLQMHFHRSEHWVVVDGTAKVEIGDNKKIIGPNESAYIPLGVKHRLSNPSKLLLTLIEIQSGSYLGEDDIKRFEDDYGR